MNNSNTERESTVIQNITLSHHFVSDIKLQFSPREVKDLTWEDPIIIKKSKDLKESLRKGILKQLSEAEYEKTMQLQYQREQKELLRDQQNRTKLENISIDDNNKEFLADSFDVSEARRKTSSEVDITGTASHPMSYVTAFEIAQNQALERGDTLTAEEFAVLVESKPNIVPALLKLTKTAEAQKPSHAYYATPHSEFSNTVGVVKAPMRKMANDALNPDLDVETIQNKIADSFDFAVPHSDFVETIDVSTDEIILDTED